MNREDLEKQVLTPPDDVSTVKLRYILDKSLKPNVAECDPQSDTMVGVIQIRCGIDLFIAYKKIIPDLPKSQLKIEFEMKEEV